MANKVSLQEAYVHGVSTRSMDDLVQAMGGTGISRSQVSRLREEIDDRVSYARKLVTRDQAAV